VKLAEAAAAKEFRLLSFDSLGSTNDEAMQRARAGDPGRLWIVARQQSGGRGRQGRPWVSPPGNLHASLLLVDPAPPAVAPQLGFVAGVALAQAIRGLLGGDRRLALKWPNDLLHDGAKLSGLLLEAAVLPDGRFACIIGCGVNCRSHPDGLAYPATDLASIGSPCGPADVFVELSRGLAHWLDRWQAGQGFPTIRDAWLREALPPGSPLRVVSNGHSIEGHFRTLDPAGRLVLDTGSGATAIEAGDVFLQTDQREQTMRRSTSE
jgi:BirA family biotin operon repressor/biotin-[acetyl-CoA-carboxylase] ligase